MNDALPVDAIVLLGFGGPTGPERIRPFLDRVLAGRPIPPARYEVIVGHYTHIGGKSPYNDLTARQAGALERNLRKRGIETRVVVAYRNAEPFVDDVVARLTDQGTRRVLAIALAPHQSQASSGRYEESVKTALLRIGPKAPFVEYALPFYDHPLFVRAHASRVADALQRFGRSDFSGMELIFTAHSIPASIAESSPYVRQLLRTAELVAEAVGATQWSLAYQSRSGAPADPWLEPDISDVLRRLPERGVRDAIVAPIGFLCDHVEVLYDLDVTAAAAARSAGVRMERAVALNDHPLFVEMLAEVVVAAKRRSERALT
jgi:ferrochelatase